MQAWRRIHNVPREVGKWSAAMKQENRAHGEHSEPIEPIPSFRHEASLYDPKLYRISHFPLIKSYEKVRPALSHVASVGV